ncbi:MAG: hypothetical protein DMF51_00775 [Acidobacteria bacterium]|nr:MAG: hypothetical protein DMF51_00775 [Acidobacteriota bacterium]
MKKLFALALLGAAAGTRLVADEGRIPISTPTTITKSGHYIVTRDLFINGPGSILAIGNNHVTIDLNGFSLQSLNGTDPVIRSLGGFGSLTIRNGTVEGGSAGILFPAGGTRVVIEGVLVTGADQDGIRLNGVNDFAIRRSIISIHHLDGIHVEAGNGYSEVVGTIENNLVEDCGGSGIEILDGSGVGVVGNRIRGTDQGIALVAPAGCLISDNTVVAARGDGIFIFDDLTRGGAHGGNRLSGNAVSGSGSVGIAIGGIETGGSSTGNFAAA